MTRKGKIARLPQAIREELNQRLQDGEPGTQLLDWLNSLPKVQAVMKAEFDGQPVADNNLSLWKTGGYLEWERDQAAREELDSFMKRTAGFQKAAKDGLADHMALFLAAKMALEASRLDTLPDDAEKSKAWRELLANLVLLRRGDLQGEKFRLERQKYDERIRQTAQEEKRRQEEENQPKMTDEEKQERIRQIMGVD